MSNARRVTIEGFTDRAKTWRGASDASPRRASEGLHLLQRNPYGHPL